MLRSEEEIIASWGRRDSEPLVSVICNTYNHERFVEDALRSFLMQETDFPFEVIVHDDASQDSTAAIIRRWTKIYPTIIKPIFQKVNQYSQGKKPFTIAIRCARARYVALCEGDDYWSDPNKLQIQFNFLEEHPDYVVCYHDASVITESGKEISRSKLPTSSKRDFSMSELQRVKFILTLSMFFRNVIEYFPVESGKVINEDVFLISLLGHYGKGRYLAHIRPAVYRRHGGGIWSEKAPEEQKVAAATTAYWLHVYYRRIGNYELSEYFGREYVSKVTLSVHLNRANLKVGLRIMLPSTWRTYLALKRKIRALLA